MCNWVYLKTNASMPEADTIGELATMLGIDIGEMVRADGYDDVEIHPDCCLCPIAIEMTARMAGFEVRITESQDFVVWKEPTAA